MQAATQQLDRQEQIVSAYNDKKAPSTIDQEEQGSVILKPEGVKAHSYDVDPFAANEAADNGDYLEFRTMGWFSAGVVGTAEVSRYRCPSGACR